MILYQQMILYLHGSIGDTHYENYSFPDKTGKLGTYEAIDLFPKTDFLISIWLLNPLGDVPKYIERLQKNFWKPLIYVSVQKLRTLESYPLVKLKLN